MLQIQCARCNKPSPVNEMLNLGAIDEKGRVLYSCEGCLLSYEQDLFYSRMYECKLPEHEEIIRMAA